MTGTKQWWKSKTIWGIAIAALGLLITNVLKVDVVIPTDASVEEAAAILATIKSAQGNLGIIAGQITSVIGLIIGVIGRIEAEKKITI